MAKRINPLLWIGIIGTLTIGTSFMTESYRAFWGDRNIWWTPPAMMLTVEETRNNFELHIVGKPLQKHLADGTLFSVDKNGKQSPVVPKDIAVRLNNWDKIKASILGQTTISGVAFGIAITLLVMGLIQFFHDRKKSQ